MMNDKFLPYGCQWLDEDDIQAVVDVLRADLITQGPVVQQFEDALAQYCGAQYAVAVSSGTAALHLACLAAGVETGDEVITSPNTFVATANSAIYCGGYPQFVDIDARSYNLDAEKLDSYLKKRADHRNVRAVIPVHFAGQPCDMAHIAQIAKERNLIVIEDACHALGAQWQDQEGQWHRVGSCSHSDMTVFSFHPVKHITTGEGGAVLTNDATLYKKLCFLRTHGITKDREDLQRYEGPWYYEMQDLGFNYRLTDFQCALGVNQLKKIDSWVTRRREIAHIYDQAFGLANSLIVPFQNTCVQSAYHLYVVQVLGTDPDYRRQVFEALRSKGIGTQVHYIPVHLQPYYQKHYGYKVGDFLIAEEYSSRCLSLPIFPQMQAQDINRVIDTVYDILNIEKGA